MREIKFRGIGKGTKKFLYGSYFEHRTRTLAPIGFDEHSTDEIKHVIVQDGFSDWNMPRDICCFEIYPDTVGQFTGLHDKNGKEIYEYDIVRITGFHETVDHIVTYGEFDVECCGCCYHHHMVLGFDVFNGYYQDVNKMDTSDIEVIGNIHENNIKE